jgi:hypothetical protein
MAGFFPHTGIAYGDYTALSMSAASGILDSICADISNSGGSVNGWSLFADHRTTYPNPYSIYVPNNGRWTNSANSSNASWTFVSNSAFFYGSAGSGYATPISFPLYNTATAPLQISPDGGTTWYSASFSSWGGFTVGSTGSLDRPYAGATTFTRDLICRMGSSIVLKCDSTSSRDFYVEIGMPASGNVGLATLFIRAYEVYTSPTSGSDRILSNYSQTEAIRVGPNIYGPGTGSDIQYVLCLYPDAFLFWASAFACPISTMYYVGNLDTTEGAAYSGDQGALWAGCSDTSYSGMLKSSGDVFTTQHRFFGNSLMNRTVDNRSAWTDMSAYHNENIRQNATYQIKARGRAYCDWQWGSSVNYDGLVELLPLDVYQAGYSSTTYYSAGSGIWIAHEFFRGKLKYLKTFSTSPVSRNLVTHPTADGTKYICLRTSHNVNGRGATTVYHVNEDNNMTVEAPSSFAQPGMVLGSYSEFNVGASAQPAYQSVMRHFAMPIL